MSAGTLDGLRDLADRLEAREQARHGGDRSRARQRLAARIGWSPGTLYNLARDRLKKLDGDLRDRLTAYAVADLEHEIESLTHELAMARALDRPQTQETVRRLTSAMERAQALLSEACQ